MRQPRQFPTPRRRSSISIPTYLPRSHLSSSIPIDPTFISTVRGTSRDKPVLHQPPSLIAHCTGDSGHCHSLHACTCDFPSLATGELHTHHLYSSYSRPQLDSLNHPSFPDIYIPPSIAAAPSALLLRRPEQHCQTSTCARPSTTRIKSV